MNHRPAAAAREKSWSYAVVHARPRDAVVVDGAMEIVHPVG